MVSIDLSASVGKMKNLSFFHEKFMADKKEQGTEWRKHFTHEITEWRM